MWSRRSKRASTRQPHTLGGILATIIYAGAGAAVVAFWSASPVASTPENAIPYPTPAGSDIGCGVQAARSLPAAPSIRLISPGIGEEWVEGNQVTIAWEPTGPVRWTRLYYYGGRCPLGGRSRGNFGEVIANRLARTNSFQWTVPWIDARGLRLRIAGFDANGEPVASFERTVRFRPRELVGLPDTCIAIIKRKQRLYYYKDGHIERMHIISTARWPYSTPTMKPGDYSSRQGAMGQIFRKSYAPRSRRYDVTMRYWLQITSSGSHGIHATSSNLYYRLGQPASHGCIRQHRADARILYELVKLGTPVYIF